MAKTIEIVNPISLEIDGKTYTLEFSRNTVKAAERNGLTLQSVISMETPATTVPLLFYHAFKMHHPEMTQEKAESILTDENKLGGLTQAEIQRLVSLYVTPTNTLFRTDGDGERKNAKISL